MTRQKKAVVRSRERAEQSQAGPEEPGSELMQQVRGWASVARETVDRAVQGADAERELARRRNQSGE